MKTTIRKMTRMTLSMTITRTTMITTIIGADGDKDDDINHVAKKHDEGEVVNFRVKFLSHQPSL